MSPRLPSALLEARVQIEALAGTSGRGGQQYATAVTRAAHVEETYRLVIDERADSDTRGQEVAATVTVITQLVDFAAPGSRITVAGRPLEVIAAARREHSRAPSHAEHWCA